MSDNSQKLLALASADVKKSDGDKALDKVVREVKQNQNDWRNEIFNKEQQLDSAKDMLAGLKKNTSASASQYISALRNVALLEKDLADMKAESENRF